MNKNLFTIKQFCALHPWAKVGGVRSQIFFSETNGLKAAGAVLRIGRKVLIDGEAYLSWIYKQNKIVPSTEGRSGGAGDQ